ncbi:protein cornichon homolog 4 isoform X2 [Phyllopteryx taeniolatus]|uniref:protein cornichon homolog 4 isoform X2 n=1 Tax=Phyllopteryx taeniolatus TaxID=161469 RepID=UPI002AD4FE5A|nr:protein cornichon homolog 4 isoform X2 [Phyllopteryx taeniolatus]
MDAAVCILSLIDCCALIFLAVYFIITLSDLECDYINARACCSKLNKWVIPEMVCQCLSTVLMLVSTHWFIFLLNLPVAAWDIYRLYTIRFFGTDQQKTVTDHRSDHKMEECVYLNDLFIYCIYLCT